MQNYRQVWNDPAIHAIQAEEFAKFNILPLWWVFVGRVEWFFPQPVTSPTAFDGKLVRVPSANEGLYVTAWGGKPVTMSSGELYTAAQRKTVDAGFTSVSTYKSTKLYEVLPGVLEAGIAMNANNVAINQDAWKSLTPDEQKMMIDSAQPYSAKLFDTMENIDNGILKDFSDKGLIKTNKVSPADMAEWFKRVNPVYSEKLAATGVLGQKLMDVLKKYEVK
jgi:TRAP-type C4-dicarboxylate transport system substrate-binding protein